MIRDMDIIIFRDELRTRLVERRGQYRQICEASGLDYSWLSKFANGAIDNPTVTKLDCLARALDKIDRVKTA